MGDGDFSQLSRVFLPYAISELLVLKVCFFFDHVLITFLYGSFGYLGSVVPAKFLFFIRDLAIGRLGFLTTSFGSPGFLYAFWMG